MSGLIGLGLAAGVSGVAYAHRLKKKADYGDIWGKPTMTADELVAANLEYVIGTVESTPYSRRTFLNNFGGEFTAGEVADLRRICKTFRMIPIYYFRYKEVVRHGNADNVNITPHCMGAFFITSEMYDQPLPLDGKTIKDETSGAPLLVNYLGGYRTVEQQINVAAAMEIKACIQSMLREPAPVQIYFRHIEFPVYPWQWGTYAATRPKPDDKSLRGDMIIWLEQRINTGFLGNGPSYAKSVKIRNQAMTETILKSFNDLKRPAVAARLHGSWEIKTATLLIHEWQTTRQPKSPLPYLTFTISDKQCVDRMLQVYHHSIKDIRVMSEVPGEPSIVRRGTWLHLFGFDNLTGTPTPPAQSKEIACNGIYCVQYEDLVKMGNKERGIQLLYTPRPTLANPFEPYMYVGVLYFSKEKYDEEHKFPLKFPPDSMGVRWTGGEKLLDELIKLFTTDPMNLDIQDALMTDVRHVPIPSDHWDRRIPRANLPFK